MMRKIDVKGREAEGHLSRIKKGVDLLVQRGANFGKPYLKITNEKMEAVEVPEGEQVAILKALVLHETGRDYMKPEKHDWNTALQFLMFAEDAFRECNKDYIKYVDNNGVLNLDILWCYLKLEKRDHLQDANKRLEAAETYLNRAFEKNMDSGLEAEQEKSVRKKILFLQLYILWGMLFTFRNMKKEALGYLHKAEELCDELQLDDCDIAELRHQGLTRQEARMGLRACDGDLGKAKDFIEQRRQDRSQLNGTTEAAGTCAQPVPAPNPTNVSEEDEETLIEEIPAPNPTDVSEEDEETLIEEMLQLLPDSADSYIDLSLEEEQAIIIHYKAMLTNPEAR